MNKTYDIDIEMTASVDTVTVTNIVVAAVEKQTGRQVQDIKVKYNGDKFTGFDIVFDSNLKTQTNFKPSKEFIVNNFNEN